MVGLLFGLLYAVKRLKIGPLAGNRAPAMRLLGFLSLAPKKGLALVEVCDQWFVVGVGAESISLISKIDRPEDGGAFNTGAPGSGTVFQSILENIGMSGRASVPKVKDPK